MIKLPRLVRKCPHCGEVIDSPPRSPRQEIIDMALEVLDRAGTNGMTDEEVDTVLRLGHQCTTPLMTFLRYHEQVWHVAEDDGTPITRPTKRNKPAGVNVLAKYLNG